MLKWDEGVNTPLSWAGGQWPLVLSPSGSWNLDAVRLTEVKALRHCAASKLWANWAGSVL